MIGVTIHQGPQNWEIIQEHKGTGTIALSGFYQIPEAAMDIGVKSARPVYRVLKEEDHKILIDWTTVDSYVREGPSRGRWETVLTIPVGGLYLIETGLDTKSTDSLYQWIFRGDNIQHIGIGYLFAIAGQSNAAGYGRDHFYDPPEMGVHIHRNNGSWDIAAHPINDSTGAEDSLVNREMGICGTSPYLAFAKKLYHMTGIPIGLIPTALGGSVIRRWVKGSEGDLYDHMVKRIKAHAEGIRGVLWYQGCSDANEHEAKDYKKLFAEFVEAAREDLIYRYDDKLPIFTFQLNRELNTDQDIPWAMIREHQRQSAVDMANVFILPTHDSRLCDGIHNNSASNVQLGQRLALQCYDYLQGEEEGMYNAPNPCQLTLYSGTQLVISFSHVTSGFVLYDSPNKPNGFELTYKEKALPIKNVMVNQPDSRSITINFSPPEQLEAGELKVSYCHQSNPDYPVISDKSTYMPILSFYNLGIHG